MPYSRYHGGDNGQGKPSPWATNQGNDMSNMGMNQMGGGNMMGGGLLPTPGNMGMMNMGGGGGGWGNNGQGNSGAWQGGGQQMRRDRDNRPSYYSRERSPPRSNRSFRRSSRSRSPARRQFDNHSRSDRSHDGRSRSFRDTSPRERAEHEIYIGNYPVKFKVGEVRGLFEDNGVEVGTIRLKYDGRKVFAFAETVSKSMVEKAVKAMDSKEIAGRRLRVRSAADKDKGQQSHKRELRVGDVTRHLVYAFNGFIERQMEADKDEADRVAGLTLVRDSLKQIFTLPEDDSLKISRDLELIFMQNNRREIPIPEDEAEEKKPKAATTMTGVASSTSGEPATSSSVADTEEDKEETEDVKEEEVDTTEQNEEVPLEENEESQEGESAEVEAVVAEEEEPDEAMVEEFKEEEEMEEEESTVAKPQTAKRGGRGGRRGRGKRAA